MKHAMDCAGCFCHSPAPVPLVYVHYTLVLLESNESREEVVVLLGLGSLKTRQTLNVMSETTIQVIRENHPCYKLYIRPLEWEMPKPPQVALQ